MDELETANQAVHLWNEVIRQRGYLVIFTTRTKYRVGETIRAEVRSPAGKMVATPVRWYVTAETNIGDMREQRTLMRRLAPSYPLVPNFTERDNFYRVLTD